MSRHLPKMPQRSDDVDQHSIFLVCFHSGRAPCSDCDYIIKLQPAEGECTSASPALSHSVSISYLVISQMNQGPFGGLKLDDVVTEIPAVVARSGYRSEVKAARQRMQKPKGNVLRQARRCRILSASPIL
jgi:hypothetical protein